MDFQSRCRRSCFPELKTEILRLKNLPAIADGFRIPRLSFYMNRPIRHGGWYPDWQIRFFDRRKAKWKDVLIHESVEVDGKVEKLSGDILHYSVENVSHHHRMIGERYAPLAAEQMFLNGRKTSVLKIVTAGFTAFFQTYFLEIRISGRICRILHRPFCRASRFSQTSSVMGKTKQRILNLPIQL